MADFLMIMVEGATEPASFGVLTATVWVSIAMAIFIAILLWKKVPALIAGMLDNRIAEISKQLKEAEALRLDAESLKAEYEAKRSEEHTSELQSLMRISYAVFCLKKKNYTITNKMNTHSG